MGTLEAVVQAFSEQVAELREATLLRVDGEGAGRAWRAGRAGWAQALTATSCGRLKMAPAPSACGHRLPPLCHSLPSRLPASADTTRALYAQDVEAIEATVRALEHKLRDIKAYVQREAAAIPQVEAVVAACQLQQQHLQHIAGHLPAYLPSLRSPETATAALAAAGGGGGSVKENSRAGHNQAAAGADAGGGGGGTKKRPPAPRRWAQWHAAGPGPMELDCMWPWLCQQHASTEAALPARMRAA